MRHARADDLERIDTMLTELRALDGLVERTPGSFYRKSRGFLHFHADGDEMYADVKLTGDDFERVHVTTKTEQRKLVAAVRRRARLACAPMTMDPTLLDVARAAKGFMPDDEGLALHEAGIAGGAVGPLLEVGTYCGKSAVYLGAAAREAGTVCFTVDHHRGSEENQAGWDHHDTEVVDPETGRMDTLPFFRRTIYTAGLEDVVVAIVGYSIPVARAWQTPLGFLFIDGGHAEDVAMADYEGWTPHVAPGGVLAIHDVFEDPDQGGQAPFHVWQRAVADGFVPESTTGSLRVLRKP